MPTELSSILKRDGSSLALLIGNGINRYGSQGVNSSWDQLLNKVAANCVPPVNAAPVGTSLTEFFDILELKSVEQQTELQAEFCKLLENWIPSAHHMRLMDWAYTRNVPVLTTNFDDTLAVASRCKLHRFRNVSFTDYYPWASYYAPLELADPLGGFGIWHINGMAKYHRSVRLGLRHYMGSVMRARPWLHRSGNRLFAGEQHETWAGRYTWLHIFFSKPLLVIGLALEENETFLRWLLLERARYFKEFESRRQKSWYVYTPECSSRTEAGKIYFLESVGFECIPVSSFDEIYNEPAWVD